MKYWLCLLLLSITSIGMTQSLLEQYWGIAGGHLKGSFFDDDEDTYTNLSLELTLGKTFKQDYVVGFGFWAGTAIQQNIQKPDNRLSTSRTGLQLFLQYHFLQQKNITIYAQPTLFFGKSYATTDAISLSSSGDRVDYFRGNLGLGLNYFVSPNIAFNFSGDFSVFEQITTERNTLKNSGNINFKIGLQYFISSYTAEKVLPNRKSTNYALSAKTWSVEANLRLTNQLTEPQIIAASVGTHYFFLRRLSLGSTIEGNYNTDSQAYQFALRSGLRLSIPFNINYLLLEANIGAQQRRRIENGKANYHPFVFAEGRLGFGLFMSENVALHTTAFLRQYSPWDAGYDTSIKFLGLGADVGIVYLFRGKTR